MFMRPTAKAVIVDEAIRVSNPIIGFGIYLQAIPKTTRQAENANSLSKKGHLILNLKILTAIITWAIAVN